uniref:Uncharacterized protein n=1 Tax=viral metagenome TaxID=1070528 RepID=A0A6C0B7R2_9ZZZZ
MNVDKLLLYTLCSIIMIVIVTSIMSFTKVPAYAYTPYLYFCVLLFIFDLILVPQPDL